MHDLNLLVAFDALVETCSVTAAAEQLHLSPSAMSRTLGRVRRAFNDDVLVRAGRGMVPTPFTSSHSIAVTRSPTLLCRSNAWSPSTIWQSHDEADCAGRWTRCSTPWDPHGELWPLCRRRWRLSRCSSVATLSPFSPASRSTLGGPLLSRSLPLPTPKEQLMMTWHRRMEGDYVHTQIRELLREVTVGALAARPLDTGPGR